MHLRAPSLRSRSLPSRPSRRAGGVALAAALIVACGDDGSSTASDASATADATTTTTTTATTDATTTTITTTTTPTGGGESESATSTSAGETTTATTATTATSEDTSDGSTDPSSSGSDTADTDTGAVCEPGASESCYNGPDGTLDVGLCVAGTRTCNDEGSGFGPCEGEVTPTAEQCNTDADENCLGDAPECGDALWSERFGGISADESIDLAVDADDGVVIAGVFDASSSIDFGGATFNNKGGFDGYLASFDGDGNHRWSRAFGSPVSDMFRSVAVDSTGAVIVTGDTQGTLDLGGGPLIASDQDVIIAKFDDQGAHLWSAIYPSPDQQVGLDVAITSDDGVILAGAFRGSINLGGGPLVSAGMQDIFVAKLDAAGEHLWSKRFGDPNVDYAAATVTGPGGAIVQAGSFTVGVDFGGGALASAGGLDVFVAKLDDKGGHLWSKRFGDASNQRAQAAAIDGEGRVLVGGFFAGALDFGGDLLTSKAANDAFIAAFDGDGGHLWSRSLSSAGNDQVTTLAADLDGNVLAAGIFAGTLDLGGAMLVSDGLYSAFVARFSPTGELLFSESYNASVSSWITGVAADSQADAFVLGHFTGTIGVDGEALMSAGGDDVFLAKIAP